MLYEVITSKGYHDVVLGNVIGSNIFNLLFILGISGLVYPIIVQSKTVWKEIPISLLAVLLVYVLANDTLFDNSAINTITRLDGTVLLLFFAGFLFYVFKNMKTEPSEEEETVLLSKPVMAFKIIIGLSGLIFGGKLVVDNAVEIARLSGVSERIIGLTIISIGTSLPELATSVIAAYRKRSDLAIGNVIGSNIFNLFLIMGSSAVVSPIVFSTSFNADLLLLAGATAFLFIAMFTGKSKKLDRWEAAVLLVFFVAFLAYTIYR